MRACKQCFYCQINDDRTKDEPYCIYYHCNRYAPRPVLYGVHGDDFDSAYDVVFPYVRANDWCGEWRAKIRSPEKRRPTRKGTPQKKRVE